MPSIPKPEIDETVYEFLEMFRQRPGIYLGSPELVRLDSFLSGYQLALSRHGLAFRAASPDFTDFRDWIAARLGCSNSTAGWYHLIRSHSASEREALQRFYEFLDQFRACGGLHVA